MLLPAYAGLQENETKTNECRIVISVFIIFLMFNTSSTSRCYNRKTGLYTHTRTFHITSAVFLWSPVFSSHSNCCLCNAVMSCVNGAAVLIGIADSMCLWSSSLLFKRQILWAPRSGEGNVQCLCCNIQPPTSAEEGACHRVVVQLHHSSKVFHRHIDVNEDNCTVREASPDPINFPAGGHL